MNRKLIILNKKRQEIYFYFIKRQNKIKSKTPNISHFQEVIRTFKQYFVTPLLK